MPRLDPRLFAKIKSTTGLSKSRVYKLIDGAARIHSVPSNIAALVVARDNGVSFHKYATPEELQAVQQIRNHQTVPAAPITAPAMAIARPVSKRKGAQTVKSSTKRKDAVFVVHGRDHNARKALSAFLTSLHIYVIEWNKAVALTKKGSPYIGEVIDAGFEHAQAIIVLMTPDDEAKLKGGFIEPSDPAYESKLTGQPRQNVIFEAGMAFGKYKDTTVLVHIGKVRHMSDVAGVSVIHLSGTAESRRTLIGRLKTAGVTLDDTGNDWLTAGDLRSF